MNWGNKLLLSFSGFAALMLYMVYRCFLVPVDLVSKEYYKDEIAYQQVIDGTNNANTLSSTVTIKQSNDQLSIQLPKEMEGQSIKGEIHFYCPSNLKNDYTIGLNIDKNGNQTFSEANLKKGKYIAKVNWIANNKPYFQQQLFEIK